MKVLVTGGNGQLGKTIRDLELEYKSIEFSFKSSSELDITDFFKTSNYLEKEKFDYVINCAAYTNVEQAEDDIEKAFLINAGAVKNIAESCKKNNTVLIHISTDYVFDGTKFEPYIETDKTNPINQYGASKLKGEDDIQEVLKAFFIFRTSWLYSKNHGKNFYKFVISSAEDNNQVKILDNQFGCPTNTISLANTILKTITNKNSNYGIYHISDLEKTNWYDFARAIIEKEYPEKVNLIQSTDFFKTKAKRPNYSVLSNKKRNEKLEIQGVSWREMI